MAVISTEKLKTVVLIGLSFLIISLAFGMGFLFGRDDSTASIEITTCQ